MPPGLGIAWRQCQRIPSRGLQLRGPPGIGIRGQKQTLGEAVGRAAGNGPLQVRNRLVRPPVLHEPARVIGMRARIVGRQLQRPGKVRLRLATADGPRRSVTMAKFKSANSSCET